MYFYHLFLISAVSTRSLPFLSLIVPIFGWKASLMFPIFLMRSLVVPLLLFPSIIKHCSLKRAFLSFLAIFWNSEFNQMYFSLSLLLFASLFQSAICKASSDNHFAFLLLLFFVFHLLYNIMDLCLQFFRHTVNQIQSLKSVCYLYCEFIRDLI